ncbi:MAG: LPP20 family lipoprotein, partial [Sulfuricurvum sp.]
TDGSCVEPILKAENELVITVTGQGVAPSVTSSPAQAYALAKRAAMADGYRQIAERVKGVQVEGQDTIKNMMLQQSSTKTSVEAIVRGANLLNTTFKEGLCEVEMEIALSYSRVLH